MLRQHRYSVRGTWEDVDKPWHIIDNTGINTAVHELHFRTRAIARRVAAELNRDHNLTYQAAGYVIGRLVGENIMVVGESKSTETEASELPASLSLDNPEEYEVFALVRV